MGTKQDMNSTFRKAEAGGDRTLYEACPLCRSTDLRELLKASCAGHSLYNEDISPVMTWLSCGACGHVFTEGYFTPEALRILFSKTHDHQQVGHDLENQRAVSARMVEAVLPYVDGGCWLDVGFGNGSLLFTASEYGFEAVGIDLRENNVAPMTSLGIEAHCTDLGAFGHEGRFSVVSMADVLEHMPYPVTGLESARRLLKNGGILLVSMPNSESVLWKALDMNKANPYWGEIEHYHNFGRARLYRLLRECGFEPLKYGISARYRACMEIVARKSPQTFTA